MATGLSNIARMGALVGDPVRAGMLAVLMDGSERAAGELARQAGASPQAASAHLSLLLDGGLLAVSARGRHRYYRLRDADVAHAIETLSFAANLAGRKTEHLAPALKHARRCYDHIAGALGVAICDSLILKGRVIAGSDGFAISAAGHEWLAKLDLSPPHAMGCAARPKEPGSAWPDEPGRLTGERARVCAPLIEARRRRPPGSRAGEVVKGDLGLWCVQPLCGRSARAATRGD